MNYAQIELTSEIGVELINASATDDMVAMAAWVSHNIDSEDRLKDRERVRKLIKFLYKNKHMSPFEHGIFTFKIDGPISMARQFQRHRTPSYNEVSARYTEMAPRFYVSPKSRIQKGKPGDYYFEDGTDEQYAKYLTSKRALCQNAWEVYQDRLADGLAKEQAREDLPVSLMTQYYATFKPRNLMDFLILRDDSHAQEEIRNCAQKMAVHLKEAMPYTYEAYEQSRWEKDVENMSDNEILLALKQELVDLKRLVNEKPINFYYTYRDQFRNPPTYPYAINNNGGGVEQVEGRRHF